MTQAQSSARAGDLELEQRQEEARVVSKNSDVGTFERFVETSVNEMDTDMKSAHDITIELEWSDLIDAQVLIRRASVFVDDWLDRACRIGCPAAAVVLLDDASAALHRARIALKELYTFDAASLAEEVRSVLNIEKMFDLVSAMAQTPSAACDCERILRLRPGLRRGFPSINVHAAAPIRPPAASRDARRAVWRAARPGER
jgi:hypothetical protein